MRVKIQRSKRMVNGIPMADIYRGMTVDRFQKLLRIEMAAYERTTDMIEAKYGKDWWQGHAIDDEYAKVFDNTFYHMCQRAGDKAGWHSRKKEMSK